MTFPFKIVTELQKKRCEEIREMDAEYYKKLEAAGFRLDFGEDDTANIMMFLRRGSGALHIKQERLVPKATTSTRGPATL